MLAAHETCKTPRTHRSAVSAETARGAPCQTSEPPPIDDCSSSEAAALREGDTRMCMMGPAGALFETDYHHESSGDRMFTILWLNGDASGYMDESKGDRILAIRH